MSMTLKQLRDSIRLEYSETSTDYFTDDIIDDYINDALQDISTLNSVNAMLVGSNRIAKQLPFDEVYEVTVDGDTNDTTVLDSTTTGFALPSDYIDAIIIRVKSQDYNGKKVSYYDFDLNVDNNTDDVYWYISESTVVLSKALSDDDVIRFVYHERHAAVSADGTAVDSRLGGYENMIEEYVLHRMYRRDKMYDDAEYFNNKFIQHCLGFATKQANRQNGRPQWKLIDREKYWTNSIGAGNSGVNVNIISNPLTNNILDGGVIS